MYTPREGFFPSRFPAGSPCVVTIQRTKEGRVVSVAPTVAPSLELFSFTLPDDLTEALPHAPALALLVDAVLSCVEGRIVYASPDQTATGDIL